MRFLAAAVLVVVAIGCGAERDRSRPSAVAAWSPAQTLARGPAERGSTVPPFHTPARAGIDGRGRALVAWAAPVRHGARTAPVRVAAAPPGGRFGAPRVVAADGEYAKVGVAGDGGAVLAWTSWEGTFVARGDVTGAFGAPAKLAGRYAPPQVAMGGDGTAVVVWSARDDLFARLVPPSGELGPRIALGPGEVTERTIAVGADGTVAFRAGRRIAVRRPGGAVERTPGPALDAQDETLAVGPGGRVGVAGIEQHECGEAACYGRPVFAERAPGATGFGRPRRAPLAGTRPVAFGARIAYTAAGERVLAWIEDSHFDPGAEREAAFGRAYGWTGGRPRLLDRRAGAVELHGALALADGGGWSAHVLGGGQAQRVAAPDGRPAATYGQDARALAIRGGHVVLAWEQMPDLGVHAAPGTLR